MSEPRSVAHRLEEIAPDLFFWHVRDDRIGGLESDAFDVRHEGKVTLIDPLPVALEKLETLGPIEAIVLTAANHQRAAWSLRRALAAPVYGPAGPEVGETPGQFEQAPDRRYRHGEALPGGLLGFHAPGPALAMYALWSAPQGALFLSDLLTHSSAGEVRFVPAEYQDDPVRSRESVRLLIETFPVQIACFAHGTPLRRAPRKAIERVLNHDVELLAHRDPRNL
jgi:glyoxylase-like metal-dependent hydrolase (beta-lactamase superfamily II)